MVKVPLRLAPLGAHSDHQGGRVTGFTINRFIYLLAQAVDAPQVSLASMNFDQRCVVDYGSVSPAVAGDWCNYVRGAVLAMQSTYGDIAYGYKGVLVGAMPIGGLSSSAAVSLAYLTALHHVNGIPTDTNSLIKQVRFVENHYLGLHNGVLDQSVIARGVYGALTVIDCASNRITSVDQAQAAEPWELLVVYSGLSRQLTATPFNQRVAECKQAAREILALLKRPVSDNAILGSISSDEYAQVACALSLPSSKRAEHFFSEADRVARGVEAWRVGDISRFGALVTESGRSSIVNYESGSPALISLYEILAEMSGVYGTRFCGGGFQGCALALIDPRRRELICEHLHRAYTARHPEVREHYSIHLCEMSDGISCKELV